MKITTKKAWEHCTHEPYRTIAYNVYVNGENFISAGINHSKGNGVYVAYWGNNIEGFSSFKEAKAYLKDTISAKIKDKV